MTLQVGGRRNRPDCAIGRPSPRLPWPDVSETCHEDENFHPDGVTLVGCCLRTAPWAPGSVQKGGVRCDAVFRRLVL